MSESNPYTTPRQQEEDATIYAHNAFGELVKSWEKMRLLYNLILLLPGIGVLLCWSSFGPISPLLLIATALAGGAGANVAFFAAPLAELYARGMLFKGAPTVAFRRALFIGGLLVSFGLMAGAAALPWIAPFFIPA